MRLVVVSLAGLVSICAPRPTRAQAGPGPASGSTEAQARQAFAEGVALAEQKRWGPASQAFERAYTLAPGADALFAWAQAERLNGRCAQAIPLYRRFLAGGPEPEHAQAAELGLRRCAEAARRAPGPPPADLAAAAPPPPREGTDWLSGGLVVAGTAGLGAGLVLVGLSVRHDRDAARADITYDQYRSSLDRARRERGLGIAAGALGVVGLGIGLFRLTGRGHEGSSGARPAAGVMPLERGGAVVVGGAF